MVNGFKTQEVIPKDTQKQEAHTTTYIRETESECPTTLFTE